MPPVEVGQFLKGLLAKAAKTAGITLIA